MYLKYYSKKLINSTESSANMILPDIKPLPSILSNLEEGNEERTKEIAKNFTKPQT